MKGNDRQIEMARQTDYPEALESRRVAHKVLELRGDFGPDKSVTKNQTI